MKNETTIGGITVGGQPDANDLRPGRFAHVINLRGADEPGNATAGLLAGSGTALTEVPWTVDTVTNDDLDRVVAALEAGPQPVLIH